MPVQQKKLISLLRKKNIGKKTPKEDSELGNSDFTLTFTFHLPHPQQKNMKLSPMHKNLNTRVVGEENLWRKAPSISKLVGPVPWNPRPLQVRLFSQPPSLSSLSFVLSPRPLLDPYASWHSLEGEVVEYLKWQIRPPILCLQQARQKGPQTPSP